MSLLYYLGILYNLYSPNFLYYFNLDIAHFAKVDCLLLKTISRMKCGFFGTFLYVEQYFIPKKSVSSWPSEGWTNQARPNNQICPNWLEGLCLVGSALKRTHCNQVFGYKLLFYIEKASKKSTFHLDIVFSN